MDIQHGENLRIGAYSLEEYCEKVAAFHGYLAPGTLTGGFLVTLAQRYLPKDCVYDVICETRKCLPDAIQLLTPCTIGNGWLKIFDTGRFAVIFYDKQTGNGVRVFLDTAKMEAWTVIKEWFLKITSRHDQDTKLLIDQLKTAGNGLYSVQPVQVNLAAIPKHKYRQIGVCPDCHEAYAADYGPRCKACQEGLPYTISFM